MTIDSHDLTTCTSAELEQALGAVLGWSRLEPCGRATAAITAMAGNPHLTYGQFEHLLRHALRQWLIWHDVPEGRRLSEAEFQIPANAPGDRAEDWWLRLALHPETVAAPADSPLGRLHRTWLMRRAFASAGPEHWPALWRSGVRGEFLAFVLGRGLPDERATVLDLTELEIEAITSEWVAQTSRLRHPVRPATTREEARREWDSVAGFRDHNRASAASALRRAILEDALAGKIEKEYSDVPLWAALLTEADQADFLAWPGACRAEAVDTWMNGARPWERPAETTYHATLRFFTLDEPSARRHLTCKAPRHRIQLVRNPSCPEDVALEALRRGIDEADELLTSRAGLPPDGGGGLIATWWETVMAVRGWLPANEVSAAMRTVTRWILAEKTRLRWFWHLAVTASRPDGLEGMDPAQRAAYACWLDELGVHPWTTSDRRYLTGQDVRHFGSATAPHVLRRVLEVTGGRKSPLLDHDVVGLVLPEFGVEVRVRAARNAGSDGLRALATDPERRVRQHVARNGLASAETLAKLAADPDPSVRSQVARNPGVTAECLTALAADPVPTVAQAAGRALLRKLTHAS